MIADDMELTVFRTIYSSVLRDLRNEFISATTAYQEYGVVQTDLVLDEDATKRLRLQKTSARGWTETPAVSR